MQDNIKKYTVDNSHRKYGCNRVGRETYSVFLCTINGNRGNLIISLKIEIKMTIISIKGNEQ